MVIKIVSIISGTILLNGVLLNLTFTGSLQAASYFFAIMASIYGMYMLRKNSNKKSNSERDAEQDEIIKRLLEKLDKDGKL